LSGLTLAARELRRCLKRLILLRAFERSRGRLFFGTFLLAKQKKGTRQRRNAFKKSQLQARNKALSCKLIKNHPFSRFQKTATVGCPADKKVDAKDR
jgi:hypothetical protein